MDQGKGSFFVEVLSDNLKKYGKDTKLQDILLKMNHEYSGIDVSADEPGDRTMVASVTSTLRKDIYFEPKK